jgi:ABC-type antimicrobial peptide transport system permease subunit
MRINLTVLMFTLIGVVFAACIGGASADQDIDRTQPVYQFRSLEESLRDSVTPRRFNMILLEVLAASAVISALARTCGVVARSVFQRTRETAVRIAVGGRPGAVVFMITRQAMAHVLLGIGTGVVLAVGTGQIMRGSMLHGTEPHDPTTIAAVAVSLAQPRLRRAAFRP